MQCDDEKLGGGTKPICTANGIQGFPTINVYKKGRKLEQYKGERTPGKTVANLIFADLKAVLASPKYGDLTWSCRSSI